MIPTIKPIETYFKGYRFRSRLEARWSVFLDAVGAKWEYEAQGYDVSGTWYLPDFWISSFQMFMEIKSQNAKQEERDLCAQLSFVKPVLFVSGSPWPYEYSVFLFDQGKMLVRGMFLEAQEGKNLALGIGNKSKAYGLMKLKRSVLRNALEKARSARFEHGAKG